MREQTLPSEVQRLTSVAMTGVRALLQLAGRDVGDEDVEKTPHRAVKAFMEMTRGTLVGPKEILATTFPVEHAGLVVVDGIEFVSLCEHHLLPFTGTVKIGYMPGARVVGLSKLARLVDCYAQRLQVQERMTDQIAQAIMEHLDAQAAAVIVRASHSCMSCRGVRKRASMVTSSMLGELRESQSLRAEFLAL